MLALLRYPDPAEALQEARNAYYRYGQVVGNKNHQGNPLPKFNDLPELIQQAWIAAVNPSSFAPGGVGEIHIYPVESQTTLVVKTPEKEVHFSKDTLKKLFQKNKP